QLDIFSVGFRVVCRTNRTSRASDTCVPQNILDKLCTFSRRSKHYRLFTNYSHPCWGRSYVLVKLLRHLMSYHSYAVDHRLRQHGGRRRLNDVQV
ncbi:hypothetical protein ALC53_01387, partial [Atta colombica]